MARKQTTNTKGLTPKQQAIIDTLKRIHARGTEKAGPTEIASSCGDGQLNLTPSAVTTALKRLVEDGVVERCPQGTRRALYRIAEVA